MSHGMVDISEKNITKRNASAQSIIYLGKTAFSALINNESPKGDVLATAKVAGVMSAKLTPQIIPFCHPLELGKVHIDFELNEKNYEVTIKSDVNYVGRTGVEMEALAAVSAAALTIYDMLKYADKGIVVKNTRLLSKSGGKSGDYQA